MIIRLWFVVFSVLISTFLWFWYASSPSSVVLLNAYEKDVITWTYTLQQLGSAVVIDNETIVTNAHVVLDEDDQPTYLYEVCETVKLDRKPKCFSTASVTKYNVEEDLAVLTLTSNSSSIVPVEFSTTDPNLWEAVKVLWYPWYWWETITLTEWKISWFEQWYYKIDANLDSWNSWWWAFDNNWIFLWVPTFVSVWYSTLGYIVPYSTVNQVLASTWNDWTVINELVNEMKSSFDTFSNKKYSIDSSTTIKTPYINIENSSALWFYVEDYTFTDDLAWPELLTLSDSSWKTNIIIGVRSKDDPDNLWSKQHKEEDMPLYEDEFSIALTKDIVRNWNTWQITYIDWWNVKPGLKLFSFVQRWTTWWGLTYSVETTDFDLTSFVNWIVMFLKFSEVIQKDYSIKDYINQSSWVVDLAWMFPVYAYGFDEDNSIELAFSFGWSSLYDWKLSIEEMEYDEEFKDITYKEFGDYLRVVFGQIFAEQQAMTIEEGTLIKNTVWSVYYAIPMSVETDEWSQRMDLIYFIVNKEDKLFMYTLLIPYHDSILAEQEITNFLDTVLVPWEHGFSWYWVEETEMTTVQEYIQWWFDLN